MRGLEKLGVKFVHGKVEESKSKIAAPEDILRAVIAIVGEKVEQASSSDELESLGFMITAGPTERTDRSGEIHFQRESGKMGIALTQVCLELGAKAVCLIHGPGVNVPLQASGLRVQSVNTTEEMLSAVVKECPQVSTSVFISAAAPADYASVSPQKGKISTTEKNRLTIETKSDVEDHRSSKKKIPRNFHSSFKAEYRLESKRTSWKKRDRVCKNQVPTS